MWTFSGGREVLTKCARYACASPYHTNPGTISLLHSKFFKPICYCTELAAFRRSSVAFTFFTSADELSEISSYIYSPQPSCTCATLKLPHNFPRHTALYLVNISLD